MDFSEIDLKNLDLKRKKTSDRPTWFNASTAQEETISDRFESWLILTPVEVRATIAQGLQEVLDEESLLQTSKNELLAQFISDESDDLDKRSETVTALSDIVPNLGGLAAGLVYKEDTPEVALLFDNLLLPMPAINRLSDNVRFDQNWLAMCDTLFQRENTVTSAGDSNKRKEIESMIKVLLAY